MITFIQYPSQAEPEKRYYPIETDFSMLKIRCVAKLMENNYKPLSKYELLLKEQEEVKLDNPETTQAISNETKIARQ